MKTTTRINGGYGRGIEGSFEQREGPAPRIFDDYQDEDVDMEDWRK